MKKLSHLLIICSFIGLSVASFNADSSVYYVDARVVDVTQAPEQCRYVKPQDRQCTSRRCRNAQRNNQADSNTVVGAVIGGAAARALSKNRSSSTKNVNTAIGAVVGGSIASSRRQERDPRDNQAQLQCERAGYLATVTYTHPATRQMQTVTVPMERRTRAQFISIPVR